MAGVLVDTDVLVDHLRGARRLDLGGAEPYCSVVTRCELFAGQESDEAIVTQLLAAMNELPIDRAVAEAAGRIRRDTGVRLGDALIASTAIQHGLNLLTRNRRDFGRINGLAFHDSTTLTS